MNTIFKTAKELAVILGIEERSVTYRVVSIRRKAYQLNKKASRGDISFIEAVKILGELNDKKLGGYDYEIKGTEKRPKYIFYKNK